MKELWFIFLIGCGLALIKFAYLLLKKYRINKTKLTKKFSTVLQTFKNDDLKKGRTLSNGKARISIFKEMKNTGKLSRKIKLKIFYF